MFDAFGAFRFDFRNLASVPDGWWCPIVNPKTSTNRFRVLGDDENPTLGVAAED
jgi:hypothetical protein